MRHHWSAPQGFDAADVYRDWFDHVYRPGTDGAFAYELTLVRMADPVDRNMRWLRRKVDEADAASDFLMDAQERARLQDAIDNPPDWTPDFFVHRRRDVPDFSGRFANRFTLLPDGAGRPSLAKPSRPGGSPAPIVAIIDDGIGYLNARFTAADGDRLKTRLARVWLQAEDALEDTGANLVMRCGTEVSSAEIDGLLAGGAALDEAAEYAAMNEALYGRRFSPVWQGITAGAGSDLAVTHGTHVFDVAGGSDPLAPDAIAQSPLLAVQLPPQAVEDTSGTKLSPYVLRGLRWIIDQAAAMTEGGVPRPLIVNVSIGVLAGSKDGTSLLERQMAAEVLRREAATGAPTRVVIAFGNDNLTRQIAHTELGAEAAELTLRVQSEDYTPSFVEIRPDRPGDLRLSVSGLLSDTLPLGGLAAGQMVSLGSAEGAVARVYAVGARPLDGGGQTAAWFLLALAPTASLDMSKPLAPSGNWNIGLATDGAAQECRVAVQRDDRPQGFAPLARQSYLDDAGLWVWREPEKTPFARPAIGPVTRQGTHSAYASGDLPAQVWTVGAALSDSGFAAPYSATGAPWVAPQPGGSAIGDSSWTLRGVMASGTLSGTTAVASGTSVAAPQITRELALFYAGGPDAGPWLDPEVTRAAEEAALKALDWSFEPETAIDQLGAVCVSREAGLRARLDDGWG